MDWKAWLSRTLLEQSLVDSYSLIFTENQLDETDMIFFNHESLESMGITRIEDRVQILGLVEKEKFSKKSTRSICNEVWQFASRKLHHICTVASCVANAVLPNRTSAVDAASETNGDNKPRSPESSNEADDASVNWEFTEIKERSESQIVRLHHKLRNTKILGLIYPAAGDSILALTSNDIHLKWKWEKNKYNNPNGKVTTSVTPPFCVYSENLATLNLNPKDSVSISAIFKWFPFPRFVTAIASIALRIWKLCCWILMIKGSKSQVPFHCFALSKNCSYTLSASGDKISVFQVDELRVKVLLVSPFPPIPMATVIAFCPDDNNKIAIGMDDSSIRIYNVRTEEVINNIYGHSKRVTGLAFSDVLGILVSSSADDQICVWDYDNWVMHITKSLTLPNKRTSSGKSNTRVQFDDKQIQFLVTHETHLAVYDAYNLRCLKQWVSTESFITGATFSSGCQLIFAIFLDATIRIFDASDFTRRCRIDPSCYLPSKIRSIVYPVVIAAHPHEVNQFALGLSDGRIKLFEPIE